MRFIEDLSDVLLYYLIHYSLVLDILQLCLHGGTQHRFIAFQVWFPMYVVKFYVFLGFT